RSLDAEFDRLYAGEGRPSIAPERLIRASLLQVLYSIRSERQLTGQMDDNLLFRWFVGLSLAADRGCDSADFVAKLRQMVVTPHVAQKSRHSAIDGRTTRRPGYAKFQRRRKKQEEDRGGFVQALRQVCVTPYVAQKASLSAINGLTIRHGAYKIARRCRKKIKEPFGWAMTVDKMAQTMLCSVKHVDAQTRQTWGRTFLS
ncbi:transposase, partial [Rhodovulum sulfidophilum]|nr:transposase [Rhodovulum sulfidophilum]